jgi:hypothetical protein
MNVVRISNEEKQFGDYGCLGCNSGEFEEISMFQRSILASSSGSKIKPIKKPTDAAAN